MSASTIRQKLLAIHKLTFKAISCHESLNVLEGLWIEVKDTLQSTSLPPEDRHLLAELSKGHNNLARSMAKLESLHETLIRDACREVAINEACEW
jgi:hypothetical protein